MSTPNNESVQESATSPLMVAQSNPPPQLPVIIDVETTCEVEAESREGVDGGDEEANPYMPKKRKRTSPVWADFKEVTLSTGVVKAECIYCKFRLSLNKSGSTTHLTRHISKCHAKKASATGQKNLSITMTMAQSESAASIQNFKYEQAKVREVLSHMIIVHELPYNFAEYELYNVLMRTVTPHYQKISRATAKNDCIATFQLEKKKLMEELKCVNRLSVTTDLWKSDQTISYMVVTGHFVDSNWNLQKRTLNFCDIPPPHSGLMICDVLHKFLVEWGIEKKVWTITVDNASNNDTAVRLLKANLSYNHTLPLMGKIFHVRCCAHILTLLVQDGLSAIQDVISKVRDSVKYVIASEARIIMFSEIAKQLQLSSKKLVLDCCTRWNATYFMLPAALEFKDVFPRFQQRDHSYKSLPSEEEWEKVRVVCTFLEDFNTATELISGSEYPTANIFLPELIHIKLLLKAHEVGEVEVREDVMGEVVEGEGVEGEDEVDAQPESAFSAGGRVIDPHRASLGVNTVQMLLCTEDWLRARYDIKRKAKIKENIKEVHLV